MGVLREHLHTLGALLPPSESTATAEPELDLRAAERNQTRAAQEAARLVFGPENPDMEYTLPDHPHVFLGLN